MSKTSFTVAVLVSVGRNPVSGAGRACRGDAVAMALGRKIAGDALRVVHAGVPYDAALNDYLAHGAGTVEAVACGSPDDIVPVLATALENVDLILTGSRTEYGNGSGLVPYALAAALDRSVIANVLDAGVDGNDVRITQFLPKGQRRLIAGHLPAILSVHPRAPFHLTYAHARRQSGRIVPVTVTPAAANNFGSTAPDWVISPQTHQPIPLKADVKMTAHERLQSAIAQEAKGGLVVIEGSCVDKAQVMVAYLRDNQLIDF